MSPPRAAIGFAVAVVAVARPAAADDRWHGSLGLGGDLLLTGADGDHARFAVVGELVPPGSRFGGSLAWRAATGDRRGLLLGGLVFEAGAARPRLVLALHADAGADLDARAPAAGGGLRTTLGLLGPLGLALDAAGYVVIGGGDSRLQLQLSALAVARW